jgi:hypothetical protein
MRENEVIFNFKMRMKLDLVSENSFCFYTTFSVNRLNLNL